jgi:hypothetical protein
MKNRSCKKILVFFALGLISCALCVQQAQAVSVSGAITFAGGVELNSTTVNTATAVTGWLDEGGFMPTVQSVSGNMAAFVTAGDTATFAFPWFFNSGPLPGFWSVDGFTFNLIASSIVFQGGGFVNVSGTGTISGNGLGPTFASWSFTAQDDPSNGVFSFSGGSETPDGGAAVVLLGLGLAGIEAIRRKLMMAKS